MLLPAPQQPGRAKPLLLADILLADRVLDRRLHLHMLLCRCLSNFLSNFLLGQRPQLDHRLQLRSNRRPSCSRRPPLLGQCSSPWLLLVLYPWRLVPLPRRFRR